MATMDPGLSVQDWAILTSLRLASVSNRCWAAVVTSKSLTPPFARRNSAHVALSSGTAKWWLNPTLSAILEAELVFVTQALLVAKARRAVQNRSEQRRKVVFIGVDVERWALWKCPSALRGRGRPARYKLESALPCGWQKSGYELSPVRQIPLQWHRVSSLGGELSTGKMSLEQLIEKAGSGTIVWAPWATSLAPARTAQRQL